MTHHLQSILDTVPDAVIVIDRAGVMTSFSPAAERLFGWTSDEAIGQNVSLLMPEPDRAGPRRLSSSRYSRPARSGSSGPAAWWWASARTARPSPWSWRSARPGAPGPSIPASSVT
jgi:PAS domain-containing protein